jgi:hypothetical protein
MINHSMNTLEQLLKEKNWNFSELAKQYAKFVEPELTEAEAARKYGSMVRKAVLDPDHTKHGTVKKLIEIMGGEIIVRIKRVDEMSL